MTVGNRIKNIRLEQNMTQKELADKIGCAEITIRQYESDKRQPRLEQLKRIAKVFNMYLGELLADNYDKYKEEIIDDFSGKIADKSKNATITTRTLYGDIEKSEQINRLFEMLNDEGQDKAVDQVELLTKIPEYQKEDKLE